MGSSVGVLAAATEFGCRLVGRCAVKAVATRRVIVQAKSYTANVGPAAVRELFRAFMAARPRPDEAWLITTSSFSKEARIFAKGKPMRLLTIGEVL